METLYNIYAGTAWGFSPAEEVGQLALAHEAFAYGVAGADRSRCWRASLILGRDASAGLGREEAEDFWAWNYAAGTECARVNNL